MNGNATQAKGKFYFRKFGKKEKRTERMKQLRKESFAVYYVKQKLLLENKLIAKLIQVKWKS